MKTIKVIHNLCGGPAILIADTIRTEYDCITAKDVFHLDGSKYVGGEPIRCESCNEPYDFRMIDGKIVAKTTRI